MTGGGARPFASELRERNRQLLEARVRAATDGLTNIPNHRTFQEAVRSLVPNSPQSPVSLVMLDIDGFKAINDRLGHQVGDDILCAVSSVLARISGDDRAAGTACPAPRLCRRRAKAFRGRVA